MNAVYDWVRNNIANVINTVSGEYWGSSLVILILFISSVTLLFLNKDKIKRGFSILAVYSMLLIALILLNPLPLEIYPNIREAFVLLPMFVLISCVIAVKSKDITGNVKSNAVIAGVAFFVVLAGIAMQTDQMVGTINDYKVDDQGLVTAQCILEDSSYEPVTVCYIIRENENQGADVSAYQAAVQYSGLIRAFDAWPAESPKWEETDYIVINDELIGSVDINGFEEILDTGYYTVFARN